MIKDLNTTQIKKEDKLSKNFINTKLNKINVNCNILNTPFYADSYSYFPISENYNTFSSLFNRDKNILNNHFYSNKFFEKFQNEMKNFKDIRNVFLLGSNPVDNYYSNMIQFLPRLYFNDTNLKIAIHRNSSYKYRKLITQINKKRKMNFSFTYLDDNFYKFSNSLIPQFLGIKKSINILKYYLQPKKIDKIKTKIYVTRENADYRKIINEFDIVDLLKSKGYDIINPNLYEIKDQIKIFARAKKVISPFGSNLTNIIFCQPKTDVLVLMPRFEKPYENNLRNKYKNLAEINDLNYSEIISDSVEVKKHTKNAMKYINKNILKESNLYKNLIVRIKLLEEII